MNVVLAEWGNKHFAATVNDYGVATINAYSKPLALCAVIESNDIHELHRFDDDGGASHVDQAQHATA